MGLATLVVGPIEENAYIYYDSAAKKAFVIDPGDEAGRLLEEIEKLGVEVAAILLTHGHFDHTGAVDELRAALGAPVFAHEDEKLVLENDRISYAKKGPVKADRYLKDGETVKAGGLELALIHTPGHSCGSCCYYDAAGGVLFSGDTLFLESVGRHDFPTGDRGALVASVKDRLFTLPDDVRVYPGHEEATTIGHEKARNPFVR